MGQSRSQVPAMSPVSLSGLPEDFSEVVNSLQAIENREESEEKDWSLRRKASHTDLYNFWSSSTMANIDYVNSFKEYLDLRNEDQKSLFLTNYPIFSWLPFVFQCYQLETDGIPLGDGSYLPSQEEDYNHLPADWKRLYSLVGTRLITEVVGKMKKIAITREEYVLLRASALMNPCESLSKDAQNKVTAVQKFLQTALLQMRSKPSETYLTDLKSILQSLFAIGTLETNELAHLSPPDSPEVLFKPSIATGTRLCPN